MKQGKTEIIIVLDRSGSMSSIKTDMEGGLKTFLDKQKRQPGECLVSLYQFDDNYEAVFEARDIKSVSDIVITPRGGTALHDALGKTINAVGERLAKTPEAVRPELVMIVTITDGQENASKEFTATKVKELVTHQTETYKWDFSFLGANQNAVLTASSYGIVGAKAMTYNASAAGVGSTFNSFDLYTTQMRSAPAMANGISFSNKDREAAVASP